MMLVISSGLCAVPAVAGAPEPLDTEFLDYLLTCERPDDNWTVVADENLRKKASKPKVKEKAAAADKPKQPLVKP
jgi:hypothetical protein